MGGGTEAFPDLGRHCQHGDCNLLDFLPFKCDNCQKVFCLDHRSFKSHDCPNSDHKSRKVVVCEICSTSIETTELDENSERILLEKHEKSANCDPKKKKKKPTCPVKRCKEVLTFSNSSTCKTCQLKVCLRHRFPGEHSCSKSSLRVPSGPDPENGRWNDRFLVGFAKRNGKECAKSEGHSKSPPSNRPVKAF